MPFDVGILTKKHTENSVLLLRAAETIADPKNWTIGAFNRRRWFWQKQYCALGALKYAKERCDLGGDYKKIRTFLDLAAAQHGFWSIGALNDHPDTTHALVLQVYREAVDLAMSEK